MVAFIPLNTIRRYMVAVWGKRGSKRISFFCSLRVFHFRLVVFALLCAPCNYSILASCARAVQLCNLVYT